MKKTLFLVPLLLVGLSMTVVSCGDDDDVPTPTTETNPGANDNDEDTDPQTPAAPVNAFYMTSSEGYDAAMIGSQSGNAYFASANENNQVTRMSALLNNGTANSTPAAVLFGENQEVRSISVGETSYVFNQNLETGKIDASVISGEASQIFAGVADIPSVQESAARAITRAAISNELKENIFIAFNNMNVMLDVVATINTTITEDRSSVLYDAVIHVTAVVSKVTSDVQQVTSGTVTVTETTPEQFQEIVSNVADEVGGLSELKGKTIDEIDQTVETVTEETVEQAEINTETGEGTIVSGAGKLKVTLTWRYGADIDLHVFEAGYTGNHYWDNHSRGHIYYAEKSNTFTDGYLDYDNTRGYYINPKNTVEIDYSRAAIENIYWDNLNSGDYYIYLHYYASHGDSWCDFVTEGPCTVSVFVDGVGKSKEVTMTSAYNSTMLYIGKVTFPDGTIDFSSPEPASARQVVRMFMANPATPKK